MAKLLDGHLENADILEIGCGTGRITELLITKARKVTCIDISKKMIDKNQERLGEVNAQKVTYICDFAQNYRGGPHEIVICSLVLIHNVTDSGFQLLVKKICESCSSVFLFEDITLNRQTSPSTRIRKEDDLVDAFKLYGFKVSQQDTYDLVDDRILFLKLDKISLPRE